MILIKSIEVCDVREDTIRLHHASPNTLVAESVNLSDRTAEFEVEQIHGRRFITADKREICIGMSKQVQDAIGLPYEAFENLQARSNEQYEEILSLYKTIKSKEEIISIAEKELGLIYAASLWNRLKFFFTKKMHFIEGE